MQYSCSIYLHFSSNKLFMLWKAQLSMQWAFLLDPQVLHPSWPTQSCRFGQIIAFLCLLKLLYRVSFNTVLMVSACLKFVPCFYKSMHCVNINFPGTRISNLFHLQPSHTSNYPDMYILESGS